MACSYSYMLKSLLIVYSPSWWEEGYSPCFYFLVCLWSLAFKNNVPVVLLISQNEIFTGKNHLTMLAIEMMKYFNTQAYAITL